MGETSNKPMDPLADLFSNVQLTGLSKPKNKQSTLAPLQIDLPVASTERTPPVIEKSSSGLKQPKRPPRYLGEEYESNASDIEIEEMDSDEEALTSEASEEERSTQEVAEETVESVDVPEKTEKKSQIDVQTQIQIAMLQQKMHRQRLALKKQQADKAEKSPESVREVPDSNPTSSQVSESPSIRPQVEDSLAKLNTKISQQKSTPSAMDLFLAAAAESQQPKSAQKATQPAAKSPVKQMVQTVDKETDQPASSKPLMGNRLILRIEEMIRTQLPLLKEFHVASALDSFDRPLMRAIWRSHRTKFLISGQLEYAVAALSVIDAFGQIEEGQLVAAYVETTASDYLIWVDLPHGRLVAAFADAKSYFASK